MKYAITDPRGTIRQILDTAPQGRESTEITDAQAASALAIQTDGKQALLIAGQVTSHELLRTEGKRMRWNVETSTMDIETIPIPVPRAITAWQASAALKLTPFGDGTLYDAATAALAGMPDGAEKTVAQTAFEKDARFVRASPTIAAIADALGLTSAQIDALFILGGSLEV